MATALYPAPPPTANELPRSQRLRLLKSTRKLEAMLGSTPRVLEVDVGPSFLDFSSSPMEANTVSRPPITPRTRAHRRRGQLFQGSSSSSTSSSDSSDDEKTLFDDTSSEVSYVLVPSSTPRGAYQTQHIPSAVSATVGRKQGPAMPSRKRSKSVAAPKPKYNKVKPLPQAPVHILDIPLPSPVARAVDGTNGKNKSKSGKTPQPLAQPILLRLRSVPVQTSSTPSRSNASSPAHVKSSSISTVNTNDELRSPLSPSFSIRMSMMAPEVREAKEREIRRKKMAKVTRTLGENVPPELVFGSSQKERKSDSSSAPARKNFRTHRPRSLSVPMAFPPMSSSIIIDTTPEVEVEVKVEVPRQVTRSTPIPTVTVSSTTPTTPTFYQHGKSTSPSRLPVSSATPVRCYSRPTQGYYSAQPIGTLPLSFQLKSSLDSPRGRTAFSGILGHHQAASASATTLGQYSSHRNTASVSGSSLAAPYPTRSASSLDIERPSTSLHQFQTTAVRASPADYVWGRKAADQEDWGKRKEREWSGEWNLKDMGDVKKKLRELKGR